MVFVVRGTLPESEADVQALLLPDPSSTTENEKQDDRFPGRGYSLKETQSDTYDEDMELARAIELSLQNNPQSH